MRVKCVESFSGYTSRGKPFSLTADVEYDVTDPEILDQNLALGRLVHATGQSVETATAVSGPPKRKRGRPRKVQDVRSESESGSD